MSSNPAAAAAASPRPWQHSASWWPQLFADDTDQIAWDDESKDYSDLPAAVAAAHDEAAAAEEQQRQVEAERRKIRSRLQVWSRGTMYCQHDFVI